MNGSALTWLLREVFTGGSVEAHVLFVLGQGKPLVSGSGPGREVGYVVRCGAHGAHGGPGQGAHEPGALAARWAGGGVEVTQDHRVAGWARAMRAERLCLKVGERLGVDQDTRSLILELEKRLANAERCR